MNQQQAIVTFSHLRWDFVYQRPQHLLSRFAARHNRRVLFIEEPVQDESEVLSWEFKEPEPNILVCRPHTPAKSFGFSEEQLPLIQRLMPTLVDQHVPEDHILWFYTPMALPLAETLRPKAIVYDCMDELSAFLGAPPALLAREDELYNIADVVFTGGPSLYQAKKGRHSNVHCFPSSVDLHHFGQARKEQPEPQDQAGIPHPRLGYFGVIDERLDLAMLDQIAQSRPDWQFVMVGPVVKIDPSMLPRRANIHYTGQRSYAELPKYLSGWDVCLLPFARNEATRFISPTKTLEYMAAGKMMVSTPITDVAEPYGRIVYLGSTPEEFTAACERALAGPVAERAQRQSAMEDVLSRTSWDKTAASMLHLVDAAAVNRRRGTRVGAEPAKPQRRPVVVVGAGPTGLSAAYHLGEDSVLLEQNDRVGGWCRSLEDRGFTFDFAGHIMFSNDPYVHQLYSMLLGDNVHWQDREAWIYSKGVHTRYPFQGALYGLPPNVIKECIMGAVEARFGSAKAQPTGKANGSAVAKAGSNGNGYGNGDECKLGAISDCCADGILETEAELALPIGNGQGTASGEPRNFEEFIYKVWGAGIAKHFAIPYNRKLWAVPLAEMETSWLGGRVPLPDLEEMIEGALQPVAKPMGPNARFGYPLKGGFQALMDGFLPHLKGQLRLKSKVAAISPRHHSVTLRDGSQIAYDHLISTMPLPVLVRLAGDEAPAAVRAAAKALRYISVRCVNIGVGRENITEKHWIYYPEDSIFHRIFVQGNASPHCNPPGGFGLTCEITYSDKYKPLPCDGDELIQRCVDDCRRVGIIREDDPIWTANQVDMPHAYVVYDHARPHNVAVIRNWLATQDIVLAGRYSQWEYYNSDHAFIAGKKAAEDVREAQKERALRSGSWTKQALGAGRSYVPTM
ncbi:MAG TPA: FAD-dependent oxidoreductase [Bryobacteraceae bacterium]|nr:FAD-dependent oxidoreductase [Bryobacteraceae bacterium]